MGKNNLKNKDNNNTPSLNLLSPFNKLVQPKFWLAVVVAIYPLQLLGNLFGIISIAKISEIILFIIWCISLTITTKIHINKKILLLSLIFLFAVILSFCLGISQNILSLLVYINIIILLLLTVDIVSKHPSTIKTLLTIMAVEGIIVSILGLFLTLFLRIGTQQLPLLLLKNISRLVTSRASLFFSNANQFGIYLMIVLSVMLTLIIIEKNNKKKKIFFIGIIIVMMAILVSFSRTAYIGTAIIVLLFLVKNKKIRSFIPQFLLYFLVLLIIISFIVPKFITHGIDLRMQKTKKIFTTGSSDWSRLQMFPISLNIWINHPLFGVGVGNITKSPANYLKMEAHNMYLNILTETGILGFIIFIILIFFSWKAICKSTFISKKYNNEQMYWLSKGLKITFFTILLIGFLTNGQTDKLLWLIMGLNFAMFVITKKIPQLIYANKNS